MCLFFSLHSRRTVCTSSNGIIQGSDFLGSNTTFYVKFRTLLPFHLIISLLQRSPHLPLLPNHRALLPQKARQRRLRRLSERVHLVVRSDRLSSPRILFRDTTRLSLPLLHHGRDRQRRLGRRADFGMRGSRGRSAAGSGRSVLPRAAASRADERLRNRSKSTRASSSRTSISTCTSSCWSMCERTICRRPRC